jgi:hypothetical protein
LNTIKPYTLLQYSLFQPFLHFLISHALILGVSLHTIKPYTLLQYSLFQPFLHFLISHALILGVSLHTIKPCVLFAMCFVRGVWLSLPLPFLCPANLVLGQRESTNLQKTETKAKDGHQKSAIIFFWLSV